MVLEDQIRHGGVKLKWRGKEYGTSGDVYFGALDGVAAQVVLAKLAESDFPVNEVEVVEDESLISEAHPEYLYVVSQMLADFRESPK